MLNKFQDTYRRLDANHHNDPQGRVQSRMVSEFCK